MDANVETCGQFLGLVRDPRRASASIAGRAGVTTTQTFDAENRMVTSTSAGLTGQIVYDGDGNMVKKINPDGSRTLFVGGVYEVNKSSGGAVISTKTYYPAAGAMRSSSTLYFMLKDHLGSTGILSDSSGNVVGDQRYYPFGETRIVTGTMYTDRLFTGQREMTGTGIYYYGARFYFPKLGRFLSADTIVPGYTDPQNLNRFSYVRNNPLRYIDPTGHRACGDGEDVDCSGKLTNPTGNAGNCSGASCAGENSDDKSSGDHWWDDKQDIPWWVASGASFSPTQSGWHNYAVGPDLVCPAIYHCTPDEIAYLLSRFAYPGQDPFKPVISGGTYLVFDPTSGLPGGYIVTYVSNGGLTVVNQTLPAHVFYNGVAVRTAFQGVDGSWYVTTHSYGNNWSNLSALINSGSGPGIFTAADQQMQRFVIENHQSPFLYE